MNRFVGGHVCEKSRVYLHTFTRQSPSEHSPWVQHTHRDAFPAAQHRFLSTSIFMPLVLLPLFVSPPPHRQHVSL